MAGTTRSFPMRAFVNILLATAITGLIPMIISGDWGWLEAWAYAVLLVLLAAVSRGIAGRRNPDLIADRGRMRGAKDTKPWDMVLAPLHLIGTVLILGVAGLDRAYGWSPAFSPATKIAAFVIMLLAYGFGSWALVENRFFAGTVGIQKERGHHVVSTGPYRFVRHPGYAGSLLGGSLIPLLLDSARAFVPAILLAIVIVVRTALEDRTLQAELPGYKEFAAKTRYRLLPGLW